MKIVFPPSVKIHCWGGLGSQLYAWALFERLVLRFPQRKFRLVIHTGGVTERFNELTSFFPNSQVVRDFKKGGPYPGIEKGIAARKKHFLKSIIYKTGLLSSSNNEREFKKIKPWVMQIRGHYSDCLIPQAVIAHLVKMIGTLHGSDPKIPSPPYVGIHLRLGDLLSLDNKSATSARAVQAIISKQAQLNPRLPLVAFSDSPELVPKLLATPGLEKLQIFDRDIWETLIYLSNSRVLIGTSSKISIWATLLGLSRQSLTTVNLPKNLKPKIECNLADALSMHLEFYE